MVHNFPGSLRVNGDELVLETTANFYLKKWKIKSITERDNIKYYKVEGSVYQEDEDGCYAGTSYYSSSIHEKDDAIHIENISHFDEE